MKKKSILLILGVMMFMVGMAQSNGDFPVPLSDPGKRGKLKAHLNYGSITVKGTARKDVLVKYSSGKGDEHGNDNNDNDEPKVNRTGLKRIGGGSIGLEVAETNNFVKVESDSWNVKISLEIEVPAGFDVQLHTYNDGDLVVSNIQGELELTNYNGEITADGISGSVVATTYNGEIKVSFDKVSDGTPMSFSTFNGDINLTFPASLKASLKMKTEQGEILSDLDMAILKSGPIQKKIEGKNGFKVLVDEWVKADINGGGPEFNIRNYNGDIIIRKR